MPANFHGKSHVFKRRASGQSLISWKPCQFFGANKVGQTFNFGNINIINKIFPPSIISSRIWYQQVDFPAPEPQSKETNSPMDLQINAI